LLLTNDEAFVRQVLNGRPSFRNGKERQRATFCEESAAAQLMDIVAADSDDLVGEMTAVWSMQF
jgi:hypothetical protein